MGHLYQPGQNTQPNTSSITQTLFDKFPHEFPIKVNTFVYHFKNELDHIYSKFGEVESPKEITPSNGSLKVTNKDLISLFVAIEETYHEEVEYEMEIQKEFLELTQRRNESTDEGPDLGFKEHDEMSDESQDKLPSCLTPSENSINREKNSLDEQLETSLELFLSNFSPSTSFIANNLDDNFTLSGLSFNNQTSTNTIPINTSTSNSPNTNTITSNTPNTKRPSIEPNTEEFPKKKKKLKLKFPHEMIKNLKFDDETKEKLIKVFNFVGAAGSKFPNEVIHLKTKYNTFFLSLISLIFKNDVNLFCEALLSSTPIVVEHIEKIFETFSLEKNKIMKVIEFRKLEQKKKKERQNSVIKDLSTVAISENKKDQIMRIFKKNFPEISGYLLMSKARAKRTRTWESEFFAKILLDIDFINDKTVLQLFIQQFQSVRTITTSSFSTMLKATNKQYDISTQEILFNNNKIFYHFDCGLEIESFSNNIDNMIIFKKIIPETSKLILSHTNLTILSISEYTKQSQYNVGFECFLNEEGIMKTRYEGDFFFKFKFTMENFCEEFQHDELPTRKEKKDFEFLKNYTLSHKNFDNGAWKDKWDNVFFVGEINRKLEKHLLDIVQIPLASILSAKTLLIISQTKIDFIAKFQTKKLTSTIEIVGLHDSENKIELTKGFFIEYFVPEGIQVHPENLTKESVVYVHLRASKLGSQIKSNFESKLRQYLPDIKIVESIHKKEEIKDREGNVKKTKKGKVCQKNVLVEEKVKQLSHIIVFQKDEIKFINEIAEKYRITLIFNEMIDFEKLRQTHYPFQETQLEINLLNFSQINGAQQLEVLDRLIKSIRTDEKEIFSRITHPIFDLIDVLKKIFPFLKKEVVEKNKVIRIGFIDHADHAKNQVQVRNENITLYYDKSIMEEDAKPICNKYHNWGAFLSPDKKECIEKIGFLKGTFFADVVSFPVYHCDKIIYFYWGKTTGDNKDQLAQINKWKKHRRCPNCNKNYHTCNTNKMFFSFADFCKCERNTIATCLKFFLDALNEGKSWQEAAFLASEHGYMGAPSHMVVGFFYRLLQIYQKSNTRKEIEEYTLALLSDVLQIADILHDGFGVSGLLCRSFEAHSWLDKEKFEEFCLKLTGKTTSDFMGGNYRKLLMNCHLFLEKTVGYEQHCCISEIGDSFSKIMKSTFYCWREIYFFSYQSALQSLEFFQFYLQTLLFFLSTLLQQLPDTFDIRKTYTHGIFHYPDLWTITDLVNGCSESGENVNYRMSVAAHLSCHYSQNIFKKFKTSEQIIFNKEEEKKKSKIAKLQNELNKFITETKYKFQEIELEFIIEDEDFKAFYNLILQYKDQNFYTCEQRDGKYFFKTNVSQKINDYFTLNFLNK